MPINKVEFGGEALIDLTADTVTANKLLSGYTAHDKAGNRITGTAQGAKLEQEKTVPITENGDIEILPDAGKVLKRVLAQVNVSGGNLPSDVIQIGEHCVTAGTFTIASELNSDLMIKHATLSDYSSLPRWDLGILVIYKSCPQNDSAITGKTLFWSISAYIANNWANKYLQIYDKSSDDVHEGILKTNLYNSSFKIEQESLSNFVPGIEYTWIRAK